MSARIRPAGALSPRLTPLFVLACLILVSGCARKAEPTLPWPPMDVRFADSKWLSGKVPAEELCAARGGRPASPSFVILNMPGDAVALQVEYFNLDDAKLEEPGAMGAYTLRDPNLIKSFLPSVPAGGPLPEELAPVAGKPAYVAPCPPAKGDPQRFYAIVKAVDIRNQPLAGSLMRMGEAP